MPLRRRPEIRDSHDLARQVWLGTTGFDRPDDLWPWLMRSRICGAGTALDLTRGNQAVGVAQDYGRLGIPVRSARSGDKHGTASPEGDDPSLAVGLP